MKSYRLLLPMVVIGAVLGVVALRSLRDTEEPYSDSRVMMDTFVEVTLWGQGRVSPQAAADSAFAAMDRIDSLFRGGLIETSNDSGLVSTSEFRDLLEVSRQVYAATQSEFDPTIGSVSRLWHFWDGARPPEADSLAEALRRVGLERYLDDPSGSWVLDFGGVAKGYAVDRAASVIASLGFKSAIINAGGDLRLVGRRTDGKPWRIAIRHPRRPGSFIGYLDLEDAAVATSGDYEKFFLYEGRRFHHILEPATGLPGERSNSVTVVAESACRSDALATGLFLLGPRRGLLAVESQQGAEAVFVYAEGESLAVSSGLGHGFRRFEAD